MILLGFLVTSFARTYQSYLVIKQGQAARSSRLTQTAYNLEM